MTLALKIETGDSQNKSKIIFAFIVISVKEKMTWISSSTANLCIQLRDNLILQSLREICNFRNPERLENQKCTRNDNDILMDSMNHVNDAFEGRKYT